MAAQGAYVFQSPVASTDTSLPVAVRDPLLRDANDGVRFLFDTAFGFSWPGGPLTSRPSPAAPTDGVTLYDVAEHNDGLVTVASGQALAYSGGGFDFSGLTAKGAGSFIQAPVAASADIWGSGSGATATAAITGDAVSGLTLTAGGSGYAGPGTPRVVMTGGGGTGAAATATVVAGVITALTLTSGGTGYTSAPTVTIVPSQQEFLLAMLIKLPTLAQFNANAAIAPMLSFGVINTAADMATIAQHSAGNVGKLRMFRNVALSGYNDVTITPNAASYGKVAQLAVWRKAGVMGASLRTAEGGLQSATTAAPQHNTANFSATPMKMGVVPANWTSSFTDQADAKNFRIYRGWMENLIRSGRDPVAVLDADWARVQARIAASAAANGGTSQIFI